MAQFGQVRWHSTGAPLEHRAERFDGARPSHPTESFDLAEHRERQCEDDVIRLRAQADSRREGRCCLG